MEIDWLPTINTAIGIVTSIVAPAAAAWGWSMAQKIKLNSLKIKGDKSNLISERITQAVYATEKRASSGALPNSQKKEFCFDLAKKLLKIDKQTVPNEILTELIETQLGLDDKEMEIATVSAPVLTRAPAKQTPPYATVFPPGVDPERG